MKSLRWLLLSPLLIGGSCDGNVNGGSGFTFAATVRASVGASAIPSDFPSAHPSVSDDGRYVAFVSISTTLDPADTDIIPDCYVRDTVNGTTILISRASGVNGAKANDESDRPSISGSGRYVAFQSSATNIHPDDADGSGDVYVRDLATNTTTLASRADTATGVKGDATSGLPHISSDGQFVAFTSYAENLDGLGGMTGPDPDGMSDIYVRDVFNDETTLVSLYNGGAKTDQFCGVGCISADGQVVAFETGATNFDPGDVDAYQDIYVVYDWNTVSPTTILASKATGVAGSKADSDCWNPALSGDGRLVVYESDSRILFEPDQDFSEDGTDIFLRDTSTDETFIVSSSSTGVQGLEPGFFGTPASNHGPSISTDGRYVAFSSLCTNLIAGDTNSHRDVFVKDMVTGAVIRASVRTFGNQADNDSDSLATPDETGGPRISGDGRFVCFDSVATNLVDDDFNGVPDVFLRGPLR